MQRFRLLGPVAVLDEGGEPLDLPGQRQRALLAALLVRANTVVSTDRLVEELWGEEAPRTATTSLHNAVSQLRRVLGPDVLVTRPPGYVLRVEPDRIDAARFESLLRAARDCPAEERARLLREALALWEGEALDDVPHEGALASEARRLEELRDAAVESRIDADILLSRHTEVVGELEALVARSPLRERARGLLMLALYRSGRQAEALQAYHDARSTLVEELGIEPGRELQDLYRSILRQERSLQPGSAPSAPTDALAAIEHALLAARLVPVLGPAASQRPAAADGDGGPPAPRAVAEHLARTFDYPDGRAALTHVSQYVAVTRGVGPLYDELHALFGRAYTPQPVHRALAALPKLLRARGLPQQLILTTGYDTCVESAFHEAAEPLDVVTYVALGRDRGRFMHVAPDGTTRVIREPNVEVGLAPGERPVLLKLHGGADERERESFVVSEDDYIDYLADAALSTVLPVGLAAQLRRSHFLFLGYELDHWSLRVFLRRLWGDERTAYRSWAVGSADALTVEYWRQRGVDVLDVTPDDCAAMLRARLETAPGEVVA